MSRSIRKPWTPWRIFWAFITAILVGTIAFIGWQYWLFNGGIFRTSSFNEAEWKLLNRKTDDFSCYRGGMAHDVQKNILHVGLAREKVEALLGKPDSIKGDVHEYFLGMCSGLQIDFDTLNVYFNAEGRLTKAQIVQH